MVSRGDFQSLEAAQKARTAKNAVRNEIRARLRCLVGAERTVGSAKARRLLTDQPVWSQAQSVLFYAPLPEEVDVWPLLPEALAAGKLVALPRFVAETKGYEAWQIRHPEADVRVGRYGIREPADGCAHSVIKRLDLILVPGVAFDLQGRRLGRGKGFYDRLLAGLCGTSCGVAFDEQIVRELVVEPHDAVVNCILTPTRWIER